MGIAALIAFLGSIFTKEVVISTAKFVAYRGLLLFLAVSVLPAVLLKLFFTIKSWGLDFVSSMLVGNMPEGFGDHGILELTGLAAYLADQLCLVQSISILISCAFTGWIVRLIRG